VPKSPHRDFIGFISIAAIFLSSSYLRSEDSVTCGIEWMNVNSPCATYKGRLLCYICYIIARKNKYRLLQYKSAKYLFNVLF